MGRSENCQNTTEIRQMAFEVQLAKCVVAT